MLNKAQKCVLLGYSGHGYVIAEAAILAGFTLIGYADKHQNAKNPFNLNYLGDEGLTNFNSWNSEFAYLLGIGDNALRDRIAKSVLANGFSCATVIHPDSSVSKFIEIGRGVFIARNVAINPLCKIGENVIINTSASIDHECSIGNNAHIAPGAVLAGNVNIGHNAFVGASAVVKQGVTIGPYAIIGAGAVVIRDVGAGETVYGNPARKDK